MMKFILRLLASVLLVSALTRSATIDGKENVFDYKISVGKDAGSFKQGFIIETKVIVRRHSDNTYNLQLADVEVQSYKNETIDKKKYALLETKLKIPFEYNPSGGDMALTFYAPETKNCESANLKRGLINVLEFYDSNTKTIKKISDSFSTGNCNEIVNTVSETEHEVSVVKKLLDVKSNCSSDLVHHHLRKDNIALNVNYGNEDPKIKRDIITMLTKSKDGTNTPKISIKSVERLRLSYRWKPIFPSGLFDEFISNTVLQLKEVRDATPEVTPSGTASQSSTEVRIQEQDNSNHKEQPQLLAKAKNGFEKLRRSLNKLDNSHHLEDQDAANVMLTLIVDLKELDKNSIKTLYNDIDRPLRNAFFQILGVVGSEAALDAVKETLLENDDSFVYGHPVTYFEIIDAVNNVANLHAQAALFYENIDSKAPDISSKKGRELMELVPEVEDMPESPSKNRLRNAIALKSAALHHEKCVRKGKQYKDCISDESLWETRPKSLLKNTHGKIVFVKVLDNWKIPKSFPWLKTIIEDKSNPVHLRALAVKASEVPSQYVPNLKETMLKLFYDQREDHEVRINSFLVLRSLPRFSEEELVKYLVDNHEREDRQLISFVMSLTAHTDKRLAPKDIFDSQVFQIRGSNQDFVTGFVVASKTNIFPRSVNFHFSNSFQSVRYMVHANYDGDMHDNLAKTTFSRGSNIRSNAEVKAALDNIFYKVKGRPSNSSFSLMVTEIIDGLDNYVEYFDNPQKLARRIISASRTSDKFIRKFKNYNTFTVKSHTESGIPVKFMYSQSAIDSHEVPQISIGYPSPSRSVPVSLKDNYKFVSKLICATVAQLPESQFKYVSGKIGTQALYVPQKVTFSSEVKHVDQLTYVTIKTQADPLYGSYSEGKDVFLRSLEAFEGNLQDLMEYKKLVMKQTNFDVKSHGQDILGVGVTITKSANYTSPSLWESTWPIISSTYQIEDNPNPYYYKIALSKPPNDPKDPTIDFQVTAIFGYKFLQHVKILGITFDHPTDPAAKAIRLVVGQRVKATDINKRAFYVNYENIITKTFIQEHILINMPDRNLKIPDVTKNTNEWHLAYPLEKVTFTGKTNFESSGRTKIGEGEVRVLFNGLGDDVHAESQVEFYRTDEQVSLYTSVGNSLQDDNPYAKLIAETLTDRRSSIQTWERLLKFYGYKGEVKFKKPIPREIEELEKKFTSFLSDKLSNFTTFNADLKTDKDTIMFFAKTSVLDETTDVTTQDSTGAIIIKGFKSNVVPMLLPSSSPIKTFDNIISTAVCAVDSQSIVSFDGQSISTSNLTSDCEFLLNSNCKGPKNMAITYNKKRDAFTVLYENNKIVVSRNGFNTNGIDQEESHVLVEVINRISILSHKGLLAVILPNKVTLIRERDSSIGYIKTSRLFKGDLCGLCGPMTGDKNEDIVNNINDFTVSGTQCV